MTAAPRAPAGAPTRPPQGPDGPAGTRPPAQMPPHVRAAIELQRRGIEPPGHAAPQAAPQAQQITGELGIQVAGGAPTPGMAQPGHAPAGEISPQAQQVAAAQRFAQIDRDHEPPTDDARQEHVERRMNQWLRDLEATAFHTPAYREHRDTRPRDDDRPGLTYEGREHLWRSIDPDIYEQQRERFSQEFDHDHSALARFERERDEVGQSVLADFRERNPWASDQEAYAHMHRELARRGYQPRFAGRLQPVVDQQLLDDIDQQMRQRMAPLVDRMPALVAPLYGMPSQMLVGSLARTFQSVGTGAGYLAQALEATVGTDLGLRHTQQSLEGYYARVPEHWTMAMSESEDAAGMVNRASQMFGQVAGDLAQTIAVGYATGGLGAALGFTQRMQRVSSTIGATSHIGALYATGTSRFVRDELRDRGYTDDEAELRATAAGLSTGFLNAMIARAPVRFWFNANPQQLGRLSYAARATALEGSSEAAQELVQIVAEIEAGAGDELIAWENLERMLIAAGLSGTTAAGGAAIAPRGGFGQAATEAGGAIADSRLGRMAQDVLDSRYAERVRDMTQRARDSIRQRIEAARGRVRRPDAPEAQPAPAQAEPPTEQQQRPTGRKDPRILPTPRAVGQWYARTFDDAANAPMIEAMASEAGERFRYARVPVEMVDPNHLGREQDIRRADVDAIAQLSDQEVADMPPIIALAQPDGRLRVIDGTHRTMGLQERGDATIAAFVPESVAQRLERGEAPVAPVEPPPTEAPRETPRETPDDPAARRERPDDVAPPEVTEGMRRQAERFAEQHDGAVIYFRDARDSPLGWRYDPETGEFSRVENIEQATQADIRAGRRAAIADRVEPPTETPPEAETRPAERVEVEPEAEPPRLVAAQLTAFEDAMRAGRLDEAESALQVADAQVRRVQRDGTATPEQLAEAERAREAIHEAQQRLELARAEPEREPPEPPTEAPPAEAVDPGRELTEADMTEDAGRALAEAAGIEFEGLQAVMEGEPPLLSFTDPQTQSTFMVGPGQAVATQLQQMRDKFERAEQRRREREAPAERPTEPPTEAPPTEAPPTEAPRPEAQQHTTFDTAPITQTQADVLRREQQQTPGQIIVGIDPAGTGYAVGDDVAPVLRFAREQAQRHVLPDESPLVVIPEGEAQPIVDRMLEQDANVRVVDLHARVEPEPPTERPPDGEETEAPTEAPPVQPPPDRTEPDRPRERTETPPVEPTEPTEPPTEPPDELTVERAREIVNARLRGEGPDPQLNEQARQRYEQALRVLDEHDPRQEVDTGVDGAQLWLYPPPENMPPDQRNRIDREQRRIVQEFQKADKGRPARKIRWAGRTRGIAPTRPSRAKATGSFLKQHIRKLAHERGEYQGVAISDDGHTLRVADRPRAYVIRRSKDTWAPEDRRGPRELTREGRIGEEMGDRTARATEKIDEGRQRWDGRRGEGRTVDLEPIIRQMRQLEVMQTEDARAAIVAVNPDGSLGWAFGHPDVGTVELNIQDGHQVVGEQVGIDPKLMRDALEAAYALGADTATLYLDNITAQQPVIIEADVSGLFEDGHFWAALMTAKLHRGPMAAGIEGVRELEPAGRPQTPDRRGDPSDPQAGDVYARDAYPDIRYHVDDADHAGNAVKVSYRSPNTGELVVETYTLEQVAEIFRGDEGGDAGESGVSAAPQGPDGLSPNERGFDGITGANQPGPESTSPRPERVTQDWRPLEAREGRVFRRREDRPQPIADRIAAIQAARRAGVEMTEDADNIYRVIQDIARRFNVGSPAIGRHRMLQRWAAGLYEIEPQRIRLRRGSYITTMVHELGHHLHKSMFARRHRQPGRRRGVYSADDFPRAWREDLVTLGRDLYGDREPNVGGYTSEGWAEAVRFLVTNPAHFKQRTPQLYADVVSMLVRDHPDVWLMLREGRVRLLRAVRRLEQDPIDQHVAHDRDEPRSIRQMGNTVVFETLDDTNPIRVMLRDLGIEPESLPAHQNPHTSALRVRSHTAGDIRAIIEDGIYDPADPQRTPTGPSLRQVLNQLGSNEQTRTWQNYMVARRVLEKREQGYEVFPQDPRLPEYATSERLREYIRRIEGENPHFGDYFRERGPVEYVHRASGQPVASTDPDAVEVRNEDPDTAAARFGQINRWMIEQYAVHYNLLTPDAAALITSKNLEYITFRWLKNSEQAQRTGKVAGRRFTGWGSGIRRFNPGRGEQLFPPLESYFSVMQGIVQRARLNHVARQTILNTQDLPGAGRWFSELTRPMTPVRIDAERLRGEIGEQLGIEVTKEGEVRLPAHLQDLTEEQIMQLVASIEGMEAATFWKPDRRTDRENLEVSLLDQGKPRFFRINDKEMFEMFEGLGTPTAMGAFWRAMRLPTTVLRQTATRLNPDFFNSNWWRDFWQSITLTDASWRNTGEMFKRRWQGYRSVFLGGDLRRLFKVSGGDMAAIWNEYYNPGTRRYSLEEIRGDPIWTQVPRNATHVKNALADLATLGPIARINDAIESSNRMAEFSVVYHRALERGAGIEEAMAEAGQAGADIAIDYLRSGRTVRQINQFIAFFNAAIRGPDKMVRFIRRHPHRAAARIFTGMVIPSILQTLANLWNDDYWAKPQNMRDRWWMFPIGWDNEGNPTYLTLPKPYALATFSIAAERAMARAFAIDPETGERGDPRAFEGMGWALLRELRPTLNLAGLQPLMEVLPPSGWSVFWGRDIVPGRDVDLPPGDQGAEISSTMAQYLGSMLDYPPAKVDYLIRNWFGGVGSNAAWLLDRIGETAGAVERTGPPIRYHDWPVIRRFIGSRNRGEHEAIRRFFTDYQRLRQVRRGLSFREEARPEQVEPYRLHHEADLALWPTFERTQRNMRSVFEQLRAIYRDTEMDPDTADQRIDALHDELVEMAQNAHRVARQEALQQRDQDR